MVKLFQSIGKCLKKKPFTYILYAKNYTCISFNNNTVLSALFSSNSCCLKLSIAQSVCSIVCTRKMIYNLLQVTDFCSASFFAGFWGKKNRMFDFWSKDPFLVFMFCWKVLCKILSQKFESQGSLSTVREWGQGHRKGNEAGAVRKGTSMEKEIFSNCT